jgi:hypothetical protein
MIEFTVPQQSPNFIAGWYIDEEICDGLISFFEESSDQKPGSVGSGVNEDFKISTDVTVIPRNQDERIQNYLIALGDVCKEYIKKYPWCSTNQDTWGLNTNFNIQKYNPSEGFFGWHTERSTISNMVSTRHLVFMTYLNTVNDGGETEWFHQQIKIQPRKGLTVIWPVDWTHVHRGVPSKTETKYITTGWYTYKIPNFDYTQYNGA